MSDPSGGLFRPPAPEPQPEPEPEPEPNLEPGPVPKIYIPNLITRLNKKIRMQILSYLTFGDVYRLRLTSYHTRRCIRLKKHMEPAMEDLHKQIRWTCSKCTITSLTGDDMIAGNRDSDGYPFASICIKCFLKTGDALSGRRYDLVLKGEGVYVCMWCSKLVGGPHDENGYRYGTPRQVRPNFHARCYTRWIRVAPLYVCLEIFLVVASSIWIFVTGHRSQAARQWAAPLYNVILIQQILLWGINGVKGDIHRLRAPWRLYSSFAIEVILFTCWLIVLVKSEKTPGFHADFRMFILVWPAIFITFNKMLGFASIANGFPLWVQKRPEKDPLHYWARQFFSQQVLFANPFYPVQDFSDVKGIRGYGERPDTPRPSVGGENEEQKEVEAGGDVEREDEGDGRRETQETSEQISQGKRKKESGRDWWIVRRRVKEGTGRPAAEERAEEAGRKEESQRRHFQRAKGGPKVTRLSSVMG